jgi:tRNA A37 methylthiotransferase MiaB
MIVVSQQKLTRSSRHFELNGICKIQFWIYVFYSERPGTLAGRKMEDDTEETKARRLQEIVDLQQKTCLVEI